MTNLSRAQSLGFLTFVTSGLFFLATLVPFSRGPVQESSQFYWLLYLTYSVVSSFFLMAATGKKSTAKWPYLLAALGYLMNACLYLSPMLTLSEYMDFVTGAILLTMTLPAVGINLLFLMILFFAATGDAKAKSLSPTPSIAVSQALGLLITLAILPLLFAHVVMFQRAGFFFLMLSFMLTLALGYTGVKLVARRETSTMLFSLGALLAVQIVCQALGNPYTAALVGMGFRSFLVVAGFCATAMGTCWFLGSNVYYEQAQLKKTSKSAEDKV